MNLIYYGIKIVLHFLHLFSVLPNTHFFWILVFRFFRIPPNVMGAKFDGIYWDPPAGVKHEWSVLNISGVH